MARDGELDVHFGVSNGGYAGRLDVIEDPSGRRLRSQEAKARIAAESLMPGVRVADDCHRPPCRTLLSPIGVGSPVNPDAMQTDKGRQHALPAFAFSTVGRAGQRPRTSLARMLCCTSLEPA